MDHLLSYESSTDSLPKSSATSLISQTWWSWYASWYDVIWDSPWTDRLAKEAAALLDSATSNSILELGCGTGLITSQLSLVGSRIVGIDPNPRMLQQALDRNPTAEFLQADALTAVQELPGHFDAIVAANLLHLCSELEQTLAAIFSRMVIDESVAVFTWPTDQLSLLGLFALELRCGRPKVATFKANLARRLVGLTGAPLRMRKHSHPGIIRAIQNVLPSTLAITSHDVLADAQHLIVIAQKV